jgi:hypothetical protein
MSSNVCLLEIVLDWAGDNRLAKLIRATSHSDCAEAMNAKCNNEIYEERESDSLQV